MKTLLADDFRLLVKGGVRHPGTDEHAVVDLRLIAPDVGVRVRRDRQVALADVLPDPRPRGAPEVEEGDTVMTKVMRGDRRDARNRSDTCVCECSRDARGSGVSLLPSDPPNLGLRRRRVSPQAPVVDDQ